TTVGVNPRGGAVERDVPVAVFVERLGREIAERGLEADAEGPASDPR
ncbi:MAG: hypothetical protein JST73_13055, partial [Actinobacteria bacterium]|nr:hypothetical protein [Actinomycetota bacterium]